MQGTQICELIASLAYCPSSHQRNDLTFTRCIKRFKLNPLNQKTFRNCSQYVLNTESILTFVVEFGCFCLCFRFIVQCAVQLLHFFIEKSDIELLLEVISE